MKYFVIFLFLIFVWFAFKIWAELRIAKREQDEIKKEIEEYLENRKKHEDRGAIRPWIN